MLSAVISSERSYPAVLLAEQLVHQWLVHPGPLVLGAISSTFYAPRAGLGGTRKLVLPRSGFLGNPKASAVTRFLIWAETKAIKPFGEPLVSKPQGIGGIRRPGPFRRVGQKPSPPVPELFGRPSFGGRRIPGPWFIPPGAVTLF